MTRDGSYKGMRIFHDAYPGGAGLDVLDLIQTTDLNALYDCILLHDEWSVEINNTEPLGFEYEDLKLAVMQGKPIYTRPDACDYIRNSMMCEYAYLIDLDKQILEYYCGCQTTPQAGNRFGTSAVKNEYMHKEYYPCWLKAVFSLGYICMMDADTIVERMQAVEELETIIYYDHPEETVEHVSYTSELREISKKVARLGETLTSEAKRITDLNPVGFKRVNNIQYQCIQIERKIRELQRKMMLMSRMEEDDGMKVTQEMNDETVDFAREPDT